MDDWDVEPNKCGRHFGRPPIDRLSCVRGPARRDHLRIHSASEVDKDEAGPGERRHFDRGRILGVETT